MFQLRGGGQHVVGMVGGVGEKVLQHHGEQVFTRKAPRHLGAFRRHRHRVAVVDHHGGNLRPELGAGLAQQFVADGAHVDGARRARGALRVLQQVGALQPGVVPRTPEPARTAEQKATRAVAPGARQARQQGHQAHRIAAAAHALHAVVQSDGRRLRAAVVLRQAANLVRRDAAHLGRAFRRPGQGALAQRRPAFDEAVHVVVVQQVVADQLVHEAERQRAVGARPQRDVLLALLSRFGAARVDAHELGTRALGLLREVPEVHAARDGVAAPHQDELAFGEELDVHADLAAIGGPQRFGAGTGADGAVQQAGTQLVEEARGHTVTLHQPHRAGVAVGQDGLRVLRGDGLQARGDVVQRFAPAHGLETAFAFFAHALQRRQHAFRVIAAFGVAAHLRAQRAVRGRVVGVTGHAHDPALFDRDAQGAGVGAVVRAGALHDV